MALVCIHCSLKAMLNGEPPPSFDEEPEEHVARLHPDPVENWKERRELEARLKHHLDSSEKAGRN